MRAITTTWRGLCATSINFTISKITVSYQYIFALCYREINLLRFISCYCTFINKKDVYLLGFICISSQNSTYITKSFHKTLFITQILNKLILWYFQRQFFAADTESTTFSKTLTVQTQKTKKTPTQIKHWKTGIYRGSADCARYYYNRKVIVYNVYSVKNPYSYGELSIYVPFIIMGSTCWVNIFLFS